MSAAWGYYIPCLYACYDVRGQISPRQNGTPLSWEGLPVPYGKLPLRTGDEAEAVHAALCRFGGFAGLLEGAVFTECGDHACIQTADGKVLEPLEILDFQMRNADIGATLDFIIPPGIPEDECRRRQELTVKNALYAKAHLADGKLVLFASLQCWDEESARRSAKIYSDAGFDGIAVGGMVPRAKDREYIKMVVMAVREEAPPLPDPCVRLRKP